MHASSQSFLGALAIGLLTLPAATQTRSIKSYLPESTALSISIPDINASFEQMRQMPLFKMWAEDEVQDFVADAMKMADDFFEQGMNEARQAREMGMMPFDPDDLTKLRLDGVTVALTTLDLSVGDFGPNPKIGIIVHLEFGESAPIWNQIIPVGLAMMEEGSQGMLESETSRIGDFTLTTLTPQAPPDMDMSLNIATLGTGIVFGTLKDEVVSTLERYAEDRPRLSSSDLYEAAFERVNSDGAEVELYARVPALMDFCMKVLNFAAQNQPDFPQEIDVDGIGRVLDALGLRGIEAIGMACTYEGDTSVTTTAMVIPENARKGLLAVNDTQLDLDFLPWVPKDTASFSAMTCDVVGIYDTIIKAVQAYDADVAEEFLGHVAQIEEQVGLDIRDDLFGAFGNQVISWSMPVGGAFTAPEMAILLKADEEKFLKSLRTLSQLSDGAFEVVEVDRPGISGYQLSINMDPTGGMGINPFLQFIPTFSFKNGYMALAFSAGDVKRVFDRMERDPDPSGDIRGNPEFAPFMQRIPRSGLTSISFTDWKANFEGIYDMLTGVMALFPVTDDIPLDFALLPDSSTLTQHLAGGIAYGVTDDKGSLSTSYSPFGPEIAAVAVGLSAVGVAIWNSFR